MSNRKFTKGFYDDHYPAGMGSWAYSSKDVSVESERSFEINGTWYDVTIVVSGTCSYSKEAWSEEYRTEDISYVVTAIFDSDTHYVKYANSFCDKGIDMAFSVTDIGKAVSKKIDALIDKDEFSEELWEKANEED